MSDIQVDGVASPAKEEVAVRPLTNYWPIVIRALMTASNADIFMMGSNHPIVINGITVGRCVVHGKDAVGNLIVQLEFTKPPLDLER